MNQNSENAQKKKKKKKMEEKFFVSEIVASENIAINCLC